MFYVSRLTNKIDAGLIIAALLTLFAVQALLKPGLPTSADLAIHLHRTMEFERAWASGVIVPRWAPNLAYGYGYPLFVFAPPLPYLFGMGLHLIGFSPEVAFKALIIVTILLYATGMYLLARDLFDSVAAGLVAATAYAFAPFALREALLEGGNVPQLLAIGLFPWPLWAITQANHTHSWSWTVLSGVFYAAIILTHLFHAFIFSPVLVSYILLLLITKKLKASRSTPSPSKSLISHCSFLLPLLAPVLGLLLSAFFWIPAFTERYFTRAQAGIYLQKSPFFIRYPYWPELIAWIHPLDTRAANPYSPLTLGVVTLILAGLGLLVVILRSLKPEIFTRKNLQLFDSIQDKSPISNQSPGLPQSLPVLIFFAAVAAGAGFMSLPISRPVWEFVEILQVAEFPWRMLGLTNLGLAVVAGASILLVPAKLRRPAVAVCIAVQLVAVAPYLYPVIPFTQYGQLTIADQINYERTSQSIGTTTLGEYLPRTVTSPPTTSPLVETFQAGSLPERLDRTSLPAEATAVLLEQTAVTHRYQLNSPTPFTLRLFHFDFPGWRATLGDQPVAITPETETGLMLINIPAGRHTLTVHFGETPARVVAMGLTALTTISLIAVGLVAHKRQSPVISDQSSVTSDQLPITNYQLPILNTNSPTVLLTFILITISALWLKPLLRPVFTVDSPREQVLPAQYQADVRFANGIQLVGYDLSRRQTQPGGYMQVVLYWQTDAAPYRVNLQPFVHLDRLDDFTTIADATNYTPGDVTTETNLPTFHWDNLRYVRDEHDLIIPPGTSPLAYAVRVGLIDPDQGDGQLIPLADGSSDTAWIDTINISPPDGQRVTLAQSLDALFSNNKDSIRLTGFEITALTPTRLEFSLVWKSDHRPESNYTVFAQLLDSNKKLVTSFDHPPLDGAYPTSTWLPGQSILDPRHLPLNEVPPGAYTLITGLYDSTSGQRLTTPDGVDYIELSTITIQ